MKKERNPIVVFITMFILLLFIVLPPLCRLLFPKKEEVPNKPKKTAAVLMCSRIYGSELYQVDVISRFINKKIVITNLKYTKLEQLPDDYQEQKAPVEISITDEINYLSSIDGIKANTEGNTLSIIIDDEVVSKVVSEKNKEERLKDYYKEKIEDEKVFFEEMGYSCYTQGE